MCFEFLMEHPVVIKAIIIIIGFALIWLMADSVIGYVFSKKSADINKDGEVNQVDNSIRKQGAIIGRCENLIVYVMVLVEQYTGLAIIFTAKNLVRQEDIKKNPDYYLVGTMLNFTISFVLAVLVKQLLSAF